MEIPGIIFVVIGAVIGLVAYMINKKLETNRMFFFILAGFLMVVYGIYKLFSSSEKKPKKHNFRIPRQQDNTRDFCPRCSQPVRRFDNYCSNCGQYIGRLHQNASR